MRERGLVVTIVARRGGEGRQTFAYKVVLRERAMVGVVRSPRGNEETQL